MSRDQLASFNIPYGDGVHRTGVTRVEQLLACAVLGIYECSQPLVIQSESARRLFDAVAESDAELAVDAHPETVDDPLLEPGAHIPSRPRSLRARSMISGVSSVIPRSVA